MSRVFLIFATALVAMMAGALFYAARLPLQDANSSASLPGDSAPTPAQGVAEQLQQPQALEVVTHPAFVLPDITGTDRNFSEWAGKNRLLNFWATWCAPCRREIPLLKSFQDQQGDNGFQVIGVAVDFPDAVANFAQQVEFNYPVLVGEQDAMAVAESSGVEFVGLPFTMFVASDGELLSFYIGELHQSHLDSLVDVMTRLDRSEISKDEAKRALERL